MTGLILLVVLTVSATAVQSVFTASEFRALTAAQKQQHLNQLGAEPAPVSQLGEVLAAAFADADPAVRERALWNLARRAGFPADMPTLQHERDVHLSLKPAVVRLMDDANGRVRDAAFAALLHLERDPNAPKGSRPMLSVATTQLMLKRFSAQDSDANRGRLIGIFGSYLVPGEFHATRDSIIRDALSPSDPQVGSAVMAVWQGQLDSHLPALVPLLSHKRSDVRLLVVQAIASFGAKAVQFVPDLERALATESDDVTRKSLQGALNGLRK